MVRAYERELVGLIEHVRGDLRFAVEASKEMAAADVPAAINVPLLKAKVTVILDELVLGGAAGKARKHVLTVQAMANIRADQLIKLAGVTPAQGAAPADRTFAELLLERNIGALKGLTDDMGKDIVRELTDGMAKGEGMDDLAKRIDASTDVGIDRARTIARTETLYAYNATARQRYRRNGIEEEEWLAAADERVCEQCGPLDGQRFALGEGPDCPLHPNCRCTTIPVIPEVI